jgi:non-heme chloroperoxidase
MAKQVVANGVALDVEDEGTGPPIVFVHGWSMSGRFFQRQLSGLSRSHRVIVPDLRGHGRSEKATAGHTVANYAADLGDLLDQLGVDRPLMVGWSMGAMVIYEFLERFGMDSVAGVVIHRSAALRLRLGGLRVRRVHDDVPC